MTNIFIKTKISITKSCTIRCDRNLFSKKCKDTVYRFGCTFIIFYTYFILTLPNYQLVIRFYKSPCIIFLVKGTLRQLTSYVVIEFIISFFSHVDLIVYGQTWWNKEILNEKSWRVAYSYQKDIDYRVQFCLQLQGSCLAYQT
jgi:hypothetical protein